MHKKRKMFFMLMVLSLLLCGCGDHELENRSFPLAVGLESEKQGCRVVFIMLEVDLPYFHTLLL